MALHWNVAISQGLRSVNFLAFSSRDTHTRKTGFDPKWRVQFSRHRQTGRLPPGHRNFQCLLWVRCHQSRAVPCFGICPEVWSKHINLHLNRSALHWKHTHTHTSNQAYLYMKSDRQVDCHRGIEKREREGNEGPPYIVGLFEESVRWLGKQLTVNGKKWTCFAGGCDRKRLFLTRRQSQS